jgi:hypothetical protein
MAKVRWNRSMLGYHCEINIERIIQLLQLLLPKLESKIRLKALVTVVKNKYELWYRYSPRHTKLQIAALASNLGRSHMPTYIPVLTHRRRFLLYLVNYSVSVLFLTDRLCGLVIRVIVHRSGGPGSIPGTTRKKSSVSGTGSTQPREYNWGATW